MKLITFEGIDGSGKTTQAELLTQRLLNHGYRAISQREPYKWHQAQTHNEPVIRAAAYIADRKTHSAWMESVITDYDYIVCDRYIDSTTAYQGFGDGVSQHLLDTLSSHIMDGHPLLLPELTILLVIDTDTAIQRILARAARSQRMPEDADTDKLERINRGYYQLAAYNHTGRFLIIDGAQPLADIADQIWSELIERNMVHYD